MKFARLVAVAIASIICSAAITGFIGLLTIQTTVMNKHVVKSWLQTSGVYDQLLPTIFPVTKTQNPEQTQLVSSQITQQAVVQTFPASYVQQQTESIIDAFFDWLDGKRQDITFTVPLQEKRSEFIANLAELLRPRLAALPTCSATSANTAQLTCLPAGSDPTQIASNMATNAVANTEFLNEPLTQKDFSQATAAQTSTSGTVTTSNIPQLPRLYQSTKILLVALPIIAIAGLGLVYVVADNKYLAMMRLLRRIGFGLAMLLTLGFIGLYAAGPSNLLTQMAGESVSSQQLFTPLLKNIMRSLSQTLCIYASVALAITALALLALYLLHRRRTNNAKSSVTFVAGETPARDAPETSAKPSSNKPSDTTE